MLLNNPEVSVVICVFNGEYVVGEQLQALAEQETSFAWEVLVAENRSTDRTAAVLHELAADFPVPMKIVRAHEKQGVAYAKNAAVKASRGSYLAFCDSDDRVGPGWLEAARRGLDSSDVVGGHLRELREPFEADAPHLSGAHLHQNAFGVSVPGGNFAIRRACYFDVGGMDESLPPYGMEDVDFSARANVAGLVITSIPGMISYFRSTRGRRALLRKVYLSGKAEYALWVRYPKQLGKTGSLKDVLVGAREAPRHVRRFISTRDKSHLRRSGRAVISLGAHVVSFLELRGGTVVPEPVLVSMGDDANS